MIKAIIFDCFGVVFTDHFGEVYTHFGGDLKKDYELIEKAFFDASKGEIESGMSVIAPHLGITEAEWGEVEEKTRGFDYELLSYTKDLRKKYKVGMLSNVSNKGLSYYMDYSVLLEHFDDIVESAKIGFAKPEARAFEIAAERLSVRLDECVFVDDRPNYIEGAQHVGMKTVLYTDFKDFKKRLEFLL